MKSIETDEEKLKRLITEELSKCKTQKEWNAKFDALYSKFAELKRKNQ